MKIKCECGFPRWNCGDCFDTQIITVIHGEDSGEWEDEYACPKCDPDMRAYGDKQSDWR